MDLKNPFTEPVEDTNTAPGSENASGDDLSAQLASVTLERDQLAAAKAELQDRLLRRSAEFENYRRRVEKEKSEFFEYASSEAVSALLPVLDDFERALKHESSDTEYARGMEMICNRLLETLKKLGLEPISSVGQPFDPYVHQAVDREVTSDVEDHTVLDEYQRGYNFKGRRLRSAMVKVAVRA